MAVQNELLVEVVAVNVEGLPLVDGPGHEDEPILKCHGEIDLVLVVDGEDALQDCVVMGVQICMGREVLS